MANMLTHSSSAWRLVSIGLILGMIIDVMARSKDVQDGFMQSQRLEPKLEGQSLRWMD